MSETGNDKLAKLMGEALSRYLRGELTDSEYNTTIENHRRHADVLKAASKAA